MRRDARPAPADDAAIDGIRRAARLASDGQRALRSALRAGATELEAWRHVARLLEEAGADPGEAVVDLVSGTRTALVGAPPTERTLAPGDAVIFDLAPRVGGWWADSCATLCVGGAAPAELRRRHDAARRALAAGIASTRPGVAAAEVDRVVRDAMAAGGYAYSHHSGHGVGASAQQAPWIRPGSGDVLLEGDVIALEPGTYDAGPGVRVEHLLLVCADGAHPLTDHDLTLD
ncbi:M24 family metallopeptidase [Conexibacter arvalis]|uniref:Xaa-Pro aminopeptidase n=1 Tax=Conexibacter arvalis TaxID=912552 RepID=A0A840IEC9_9ACTN|nr:M24 family metallopeptidase [Conexibacter arvalis]MBB4662424.1 Xaa-Pro aminopeptidase [Conexibacter arvalis]